VCLVLSTLVFRLAGSGDASSAQVSKEKLMRSQLGWVAALAVVLSGFGELHGESPWATLAPFKRIDANPNQSYELRDAHGPWLILAANFSGQGAQEQAHELVLELRRRFKLSAYVHSRSFDFTQPVVGNSIDPYTGEPAKMRYAHDDRFDAVAVLVGDFDSVDDPKLQKTLEQIKYARPDCLDLTKRNWSTQRFVGFREWQRRVNTDPAKRKRGPMGSAFVTRNPLLPEEYFTPGGLDDFVVALNKDVKYNLLENQGKYTVRVASFGGRNTMDLEEIEEIERTGKVSAKLEVAADKAHRLTVALRSRGVEAYEFHDRTESIVCIGSFDSVGDPRPDGKIEINPAVHQVMQQWGAAQQRLPGQAAVGLQPKTLNGISFDIQPIPVLVPRRSIAADYARHKSPRP